MTKEKLKCREEYVSGDSVCYYTTACPSTCILFCYILKSMHFFFIKRVHAFSAHEKVNWDAAYNPCVINDDHMTILSEFCLALWFV